MEIVTCLSISSIWGEDEEGCSTHACMVKQHYTKIVIVGCGTNCVDCKGYADWYKDKDGYTC